MAEAKPLASLSGSLLARKGAAKPAMRRQGMAGFGQMLTPQDDLGWNDMGYDVNPTPSEERAAHQRIDLTPMMSPIQAVRDVGPVDDADMDGEGGDAGEAQDVPSAVPLPEVVRQRQLLAEKMTPRVPLNLGGNQPGLRAAPLSGGEGGEDAAPAAPDRPDAVSPVVATPVAAPIDAPAAIPETPAPVMPTPVMAPPVMPAPVMPAAVTPSPFAGLTPSRTISAPAIVAGQTASADSAPQRILARTPRREVVPGSKAAFTLRIDPERHLRLRLASAVTRRSAQVILIEALDTYLKSLPDIDALAHQAAQKK